MLLLKASAIAGLLAGCSLRVLENLQGRQDLEKYASHCIAEGTLVDRCMREVDAAATSGQLYDLPECTVCNVLY